MYRTSHSLRSTQQGSHLKFQNARQKNLLGQVLLALIDHNQDQESAWAHLQPMQNRFKLRFVAFSTLVIQAEFACLESLLRKLRNLAFREATHLTQT